MGDLSSAIPIPLYACQKIEFEDSDGVWWGYSYSSKFNEIIIKEYHFNNSRIYKKNERIG